MFSGSGQEQRGHEVYSEDQVRRVLGACDIEIQGEVDTDYLIYCPWHSNYRTAAGEVAKDTGYFYCFGCQHSESLPGLIMFVTGRNFFEALRLIDSKGKPTSILDEVTKILETKTEFEPFDMTVVNRLNMAALSPGRGKEYLNGRGITNKSIAKYLLGYSEVRDMVTVPVHSPDGICVGFVGRSIEGKTFNNSVNLPRSRTLFNLHRVRRYEKVFLVEASFDAMLIEQAGKHAVATLGASVSRQQIDLLKRYFTSIILVQDDDDAGLMMRKKVKENLGTKAIAVKPPQGFKDLGAMGDKDRSEFLDQFDNEIDYILKINDKEKR